MEPAELSDVSRLDLALRRSESGLRPNMSSVFEYRRLAAASIDLAKRAVVLADRTRLLLIAEGWLNLAERVRRNSADPQQGDSIEQPKSAEHAAAASPLRGGDAASSPPACN